MINRLGCVLLAILLLGDTGCKGSRDPVKALQAEVEECQHTDRTGQIEALIDGGAPADFKLENGRTPLLEAAKYGNLTLAQKLIAKGASVLAADGWGNTPLEQAMLSRHVPITRLLLEKGADAIALTSEGDKMMIWCADTFPNVEVVTMLLDHKFRVDAPERGETMTPLMYAMHPKRQDLALLLLQRGANPNVVDDHKDTPLHLAASRNMVPAAKALLDRGAALDARNKQGATPLSTARAANSKEMIDLLNLKGAKE